MTDDTYDGADLFPDSAESDLFDFTDRVTESGAKISLFNKQKQDETHDAGPAWKMLIVDDDKDVHIATRLVLDDFTFQGRAIELISAYSALEARKIFEQQPGIAVVLLDVVMETHDAGLRMVHFIRKDLGNPYVRIILRTGQPGEAPEEDVIILYDINDYKMKSELTSTKVKTAVITGLRSYQTLIDLKSYQEELEDKVDLRTAELNEALNVKNKFFSIISHDLRSPFNSLIGLSKMMAESLHELDEKELKDYLSLMVDTSSDTLGLLDNLLNWARSQTNSLKCEPSQIDLARITAGVIRVLTGAANDKKIKLLAEADYSVSAFADENMVTTIIRNLIANAIKFTNPDGEIRITFRKENDGEIVISVSDNGVGMEEEVRNNLFAIDEKTYSTKGTADETGSGLGLVLCQEFVKKNGGTIFCESEEGKGSTFSFTLPAGPT